MRKIFTLFALCAAISLSAATVFDYSSSVAEQTKDGYTVSLSKAKGSTDPSVYDNGVRLYAKNTITITGQDITKVEVTFAKQGSKPYSTLSASVGDLVSGGESSSNDDPKTDIWTGSTNTLVLTLGESGQRLIRRIVINRSDGEVIDDPMPDPGTVDPITPTELDENYVYTDTAFVLTPTLAEPLTGSAYSFVDNNIKVDCSMGAIFESYFACHAEKDITFTATKEIKGIVIKGFVKKDFSATSSVGNISFATTNNKDGLTADPVVVITDIDSKSVTIHCLKQLRCFEVRVFFAENPEDQIVGGGSGGEVIELNYNAGEAYYYPEYSIEGLFYNYIVALWNEANEDIFVGLDIYTDEEGVLEGEYSYGDGSLSEYAYYQYGAGDEDYYFITDGAVTITKEDDETYTVSGYITCEDGNTYEFSYTGPLPIVEEGDDDEGVENIFVPLDKTLPMYDIQGRPVDKSYRGIILQNGKKYLQ